MPKNILVIDDDVLVLKTVKKLLDREGYIVETAKSATEAIEKLKDHVFNLIISDVRMPVMDGIEFLERIKKENKTPVIYITGYASEEAPIRALKLGAKDYVLKPFDIDKLLDSIKNNLS